MTAPHSTLRIRAADLHEYCTIALERVGVSKSDAQTTSDVLVMTDTWGVHTHGTKALRHYVKRLQGGGLRGTGRPEVVSDGPAWAIVDGNSSLGMVTSVFAMRTAIEKARTSGIGYVGVRNTCHFGAAGYYANLAADEGFVGLAMANDIPSVAAPGSRGAITGSNPLAYAIPTGQKGRSILLDMATSVVAGGKVAAAHALGKPIPAGWVIDCNGKPSADPAAFINGGCLQPMAGHKGYGIALLIESLSALVTGAMMTRQVLAWMGSDPSVPTGHGAGFIAIDVGAMMPLDAFEKRVDALIAEIHEAPRAEGVVRIYLPGEMEWDRRERALTNGIDLPPDVVESLGILAVELKLPRLESHVQPAGQ